ncbi:MAG: UDP-galactopyranose mutase [Mogibacterium sp.]|nr:UDP-galactopyranose mutase [Mogibacterium sp.]
MSKYDYLIVGAGLYGAVMARELTDHGLKVIVVEKRSHVAGNAYTVYEDGIIVHKYGPHIFHTDNEDVWQYVNRFAEFNSFINAPAAMYKDRLYTLPFNMKTFEEMWDVRDSGEARRIIQLQAGAAETGKEPGSLEEQAISMVGTEIYRKLIKGYSEKQWGRECSSLPASIIKRLPVRFDYRDSYYDDRYQGVPRGGYTPMVEKMLKDIDVMLCTDYYDPDIRPGLDDMADKVICSGMIDAYYGYCFGKLEYRSIAFEEKRIDGIRHFQDRAVINHTDMDVPYTRTTEHKYFEADPAVMEREFTVITREYPEAYDGTNEPYYPVTDKENSEMYERYKMLAENDERVYFGGRLGSFRYYDMDDVIAMALEDTGMLMKQHELHLQR